MKAFATSLLLHVALIAIAAAIQAPVFVRTDALAAKEGTRAEKFRSPEAIQRERAELIRRALADRASGRLRLGDFVLAADALDGEEARELIDFDAARSRHHAVCAELRAELERDEPVAAVRKVFANFAYSIAVDRMASMLLDRAGSCGPTAQLIASCLHDLGRRRGLALRYWGGVNEGGMTHLTATWTARGVTYDLATGEPVAPGGVSFPADAIVDAYARGVGGSGGSEAFAYPPNASIFPGGDAPLFSTRRGVASGARVSSSEANALVWWRLSDESLEMISRNGLVAADLGTDATACVMEPYALFSKAVSMQTASGSADVELLRAPSGPALEVLSAVLSTYERWARRDGSVDRLVAGGCLALAYRWAALRYSAAGYEAVGREASRRADRARSTIDRLLKSQTPEGLARLSAHPDHWTLVASARGTALLLALEQPKSFADAPESWSAGHRRIQALLSEPESRDQLFELTRTRSLEDKYALLSAIDSLQMLGAEVELPEQSWVPRAVAAQQRFVSLFVGKKSDVARIDAARVEFLQTIGATPDEIRKLTREQTRARERFRKAIEAL
jgi:hypothetical protein